MLVIVLKDQILGELTLKIDYSLSVFIQYLLIIHCQYLFSIYSISFRMVQEVSAE